MPGTSLSPKEVARIGDEAYERVRAQLEPEIKGRFFVVDVHSGNFEVADTDADATRALFARNAEAFTWAVRIGYEACYILAGPVLVSDEISKGEDDAQS